jgi:type III secretion protein J
VTRLPEFLTLPSPTWRIRQLQSALFALLLGACSASVASDLDESDANRVVVGLREANVGATKLSDPQNEGKYVVEVAVSDVSLALAALQSRGLPAPQSAGILDSLGENGLVASRANEQARLVVGTAGELERTLRSLEGVLSTRVHLAVPNTDPLLPEETPKHASASVLLRHRGASPPVAATEIQRLVAGAVAGMDPERVAVVLVPVTTSDAELTQSVVALGPLSVTQSSLSTFKVMMLGVVAINLLLVGTTLMLWQRAKTARNSTVTEPS